MNTLQPPGRVGRSVVLTALDLAESLVLRRRRRCNICPAYWNRNIYIVSVCVLKRQRARQGRVMESLLFPRKPYPPYKQSVSIYGYWFIGFVSTRMSVTWSRARECSPSSSYPSFIRLFWGSSLNFNQRLPLHDCLLPTTRKSNTTSTL